MATDIVKGLVRWYPVTSFYLFAFRNFLVWIRHGLGGLGYRVAGAPWRGAGPSCTPIASAGW